RANGRVAGQAPATGPSRFPSEWVVHRRRRHWMAKEKRKRKEKEEKPWKKQKKRFCIFCKEKIAYVDYKDVGMLRKFVSDRGKIRARRVSGNCAQARATASEGPRRTGAEGAGGVQSDR